jgi:hypothetical protein
MLVDVLQFRLHAGIVMLNSKHVRTKGRDQTSLTHRGSAQHRFVYSCLSQCQLPLLLNMPCSALPLHSMLHLLATSNHLKRYDSGTQTGTTACHPSDVTDAGCGGGFFLDSIPCANAKRVACPAALPAVLQGPSASRLTGLLRSNRASGRHPAAASGDGSHHRMDLPYTGSSNRGWRGLDTGSMRSDEPTANLLQQLSGGSAYGAAQVGSHFTTLLSSPAARFLLYCS